MKITTLERAPGVFRLRIEKGRDKDGKRQFNYETVRGTADDAGRRRFELLDAHEKGTFTAPDKITVAQFFTQWLRNRRALNKIGRSTAENYEDMFRLYVEPTLGGTRLQRVRGADVQALYTALIVEPRSNGRTLNISSVAHIHRIVATMFRAARKARLITINPMEEVEPPRAPKAKPKALEAANVEKLMAVIGDHPLLGPLAVLGLGAGLRRGEAVGLRWKDVDLDGARLHVQGQLVQYRDGTVEWRAPKTESGVRTVSVSGEIVDMLRKLRVDAGKARMALGLGGGLDDAYVFTEDGVKPIRPNNVTHTFQYHCERLGLPLRFSFHGTRHTHLTVLLQRVGQAGAKAVSQRAGHADITTTLRTYQAVFESDDRALAELGYKMYPATPKS